MAHGNVREYLKGDVVWRKKYFYVLRPLLAMRWINQGLGPVPIEFSELVDATVSDPSLRKAIDDILSAKRSGVELDRGPRIAALSDFIQHEIALLEQTASGHATPTLPDGELNELFRSTLQEVWHSERHT